MIYAVLANLYFDTPAKQDQLSQFISDKIAGKLIWGSVIRANGFDEFSKPTSNIEIRLENQVDMDELYDLIKDKMIHIPVLKGTVSKHNCFHDGRPLDSCHIKEEFKKE